MQVRSALVCRADQAHNLNKLVVNNSKVLQPVFALSLYLRVNLVYDDTFASPRSNCIGLQIVVLTFTAFCSKIKLTMKLMVKMGGVFVNAENRYLSQKLREARGGQSLRDFGQKCGISHAYLAKIEIGVSRGNPVRITVRTLAKLVQGGVKIDYDYLIAASLYEGDNPQSAARPAPLEKEPAPNAM